MPIGYYIVDAVTGETGVSNQPLTLGLEMPGNKTSYQSKTCRGGCVSVRHGGGDEISSGKDFATVLLYSAPLNGGHRHGPSSYL